MSVLITEEQVSARSVSIRGTAGQKRASSQPIAKIMPDRRKYRRVKVSLQGRFMSEDKQDYPCEVVDMSAGGMALKTPVFCEPGERIANLLTWYVNRELGSEERQHERMTPRIAAQKLILPNGDVLNCRVLDVSLTGASIAVAIKPPIDTVVVLGRPRGRIVRHHDQGVAI